MVKLLLLLLFGLQKLWNYSTFFLLIWNLEFITENMRKFLRSLIRIFWNCNCVIKQLFKFNTCFRISLKIFWLWKQHIGVRVECHRKFTCWKFIWWIRQKWFQNCVDLKTFEVKIWQNGKQPEKVQMRLSRYFF